MLAAPGGSWRLLAAPGGSWGLRLKMADPPESFLPMIFKGKSRNVSRSKEPTGQNPHKVFSRPEISRSTKSLKQNVCVEMLQNGDHRSFSELVCVLSLERRRRRDSTDPRVIDSLPRPLQDRPEQIHNLKHHLTHAEHAQRTGRWSQVCARYLSLARCFSCEQDLWLRVHFLLRCCEQRHGAGSRDATEAHAHLTELRLQQGDLRGALRHAELCLQQGEEGGWLDSSGCSLKSRAQEALWSIYTRLANAALEEHNHSRGKGLLQRALQYAKDSGNKHIEGEAVYKLGVTSQICGDHSAAKKYLHMYMRICEEMKDTSGLGKAYKSLAKTFESEGDTQEALLCLEKLCDGSIDAPPHDSVHAYLTAGGLYFNMRSFGRACASYQRGVDGAAALGDVAALHKAQKHGGAWRKHSRT
ncbi:tetratricopeptide repeat protein 29 [Boleophthalmus pectinirostris]|uniref:tetratricopeptide repeat protein 29 n=1 Tax=Boleophthalmus pectinirostris TaxID=150288 RepID=UPI00242E18C0|nr:tetratricopeptide repeat protein 29 [Boleophthalmus pectinirostris]